MQKSASRKILGALLGTMLCVSGSASAETSFFAEVPAGDWTYGVVNELIAGGNIEHHKEIIPSGRVLSRFEMAVIVKDAQESAGLSAAQQEALSKLAAAYASDVRKVKLLGQLERMDALQNNTDDAYAGTPVRPQVEPRKLTPQDVKNTNDAGKVEAYPVGAKQASKEAAPPPKKPLLDDKYSLWGFARMRFQNNDWGDGMHRRYNHYNVHLVHMYKVNPRWTIVVGNEFQRGLDTINDKEPRHADADLDMQTNLANELILEGKFKHFDVSIGRMYDIGTYGFGIDSRVTGVQVRVPGKITTTAFHGRVIDWPGGPGDSWFANNANMGQLMGIYQGRQKDWLDYTALKFETAPDAKSKLSFGIYGISPSARHYQKDDKHRVLYGFMGYERQLTKKWNITAVVEDSNAHVDTELVRLDREGRGFRNKNYTSSKPVFYGRLTYGKADIMKRGSWSAWLSYLYQPTLSQFSDTQEFFNAKGWRPGINYVLDEKLLLEAYATFAKDIDTGERRNDVRAQLNMFF